jgi:hypothetical protein
MIENDPPPRPKRIDYPDSRSYHRAYEGWRVKYDPKRKAASQARSRAYQEKHRERLLADKKAQYAADPEKFKARQAQWRDGNRDKLQAKDKRRYQEKPGVFRLSRPAIKRASPPWLTVDHWLAMSSLYQEAMRLTEETGELHTVDHIWPLKGRRSCGLHVPWNLQILLHADNMKKGRKEPD